MVLGRGERVNPNSRPVPGQGEYGTVFDLPPQGERDETLTGDVESGPPNKRTVEQQLADIQARREARLSWERAQEELRRELAHRKSEQGQWNNKADRSYRQRKQQKASRRRNRA